MALERDPIVAASVALLLGLVLVFPALPAGADEAAVTTLVRVLGPADEDTFRSTGIYETIWVGDVVVPGDFHVTAASGKEYRLYVEDGRYKVERRADGETWDRGPGSEELGATSVMAAVHQASIAGGFEYELSDVWYPGSGFYLTGVSGFRAHGTVGWNYRVDNGDIAPAPQDSIDMFLLGYDTSGPPPPHDELIVYWGYGTGCRPLRIQSPDAQVRCGETVEFTVEVFVDDGHSGDGDWVPLEGAVLSVDELSVQTGPGGIAEVAFDEPGTYHVSASAPYDGDYYYIPSEGVTTVDVEGPCRIISFTVVDHGDPGLNFGLVLRGTEDRAELAQVEDHGAVTLYVAAETTVDCELLMCGAADPENQSGNDSLALSGFKWSTGPSAADAVPVTTDWATVGASSAGVQTSVDVWHWLSIPENQAPDAYSGEFRYRIESPVP